MPAGEKLASIRLRFKLVNLIKRKVFII